MSDGGPRVLDARRNWRRPLIRAALNVKNPNVLSEIELIRSIEWSADKVANLQIERTEQLLLHAWAQTAYYREILEACGAVRNGKVDMGRFDDIPFLTKEIVRSQFERLTAAQLPNGRRAYANRSGGSTGQPLRFMQDNVYWDVTIATRTYHFSLGGKHLGEREMKIWGSERDLQEGTIGLKAKVENWVYNRRFEQCFYLPEEKIQRILKSINSWKPKMLWCYRDGIYAIAQYINKHSIRMHSPAAIISGGASLYPFMTEAIEKAFGSPAISAYGSRELGAAACQCAEHKGMHIASNAHLIEAIGSDGRPVLDQDGELAITPLMNYAMPMIRYRIGDRGRITKRPCQCGRGFPLLDELSGRTIESLVNHRGEHVDPIYFVHLLGVMNECDEVSKFQVIQELDGSVTINVVPRTGAAENEVNMDHDGIRKNIRLVMGPDCAVRFALVNDIPLTPSGKYPYVIRRVPATST